MKKTHYMIKSALAVLMVLSCLFMYSCSLIFDTYFPEEEPEYTVRLVYGNGNEDTLTTVTSGGKIEISDTPVYDMHIFCGWYRDEACTKPYDPDSEITQDITLYAKWDIDYAKLTNMVTENLIKSCVYVRRYKMSYLNPSDALGSGVIFKVENSIAYCLTNCHVTGQSTAKNVYFMVVDCYGNEHEAALVSCSPDYDLAVVAFICTGTELSPVSFAEKNIDEGEPVIAIGGPQRQINAVTYGKTVDYEEVTLVGTENSSITFPVICHSAPMYEGSSGGGLFDVDFNLVGINYASATYTSDDGEKKFSDGYAVPIEKVKEFLSSYFEK